MLDNLNSSEVIMTLLWIMMTGGFIWIFDNILKRFENVMEDGFKQQARNLNQSVRVNMAIILLCVSAYAYFRFYKGDDLSILTESGLMGNILWIFSTIGKFLLHLLAYVVYWGYDSIGGDYNIPKPIADAEVFIGFAILFSYFVIKRLFFRNVNPLVWAMIVVLIAGGLSYLSENSDRNWLEAIQERTQNNSTEPRDSKPSDSTTDTPTDSDTDTELELQEEGTNEISDNGRPKEYRPENHIRNSWKYKHIESLSDEELLPHLEQLIAAINEFSSKEAQTEPQEEDYVDNQVAFQQAIVNHIQDMLNSPSYQKVKDKLDEFEREGWHTDPRVQIVIQLELCEFYFNYFERYCPDYATSVPMAN